MIKTTDWANVFTPPLQHANEITEKIIFFMYNDGKMGRKHCYSDSIWNKPAYHKPSHAQVI